MEAASPEAAAFLCGLEFSGARPKELADATVADFDGQCVKLSHQKGRPPEFRSRYVVLDEDGMGFFKTQAKGKVATAKLFTTADAGRGGVTSRSKKSARRLSCTTRPRMVIGALPPGPPRTASDTRASANCCTCMASIRSPRPPRPARASA